MTAPKLTARKIDRLLWLAHRLSRARAKAKSAGGHFGDETESLKSLIMIEMRPHLIAILKCARDSLTRNL